MSYVLAKPKTAQDGVVEFLMHPVGGQSGDEFLFRVKPAQVVLAFQVQVADVTGADDEAAVFTHNQLTVGSFQMQGYALGNEFIGIENLQSYKNGAWHGYDPDGAGGTDAVSLPMAPDGATAIERYNMRFNYASGKYIAGVGIVESIQVSYARASPFVGVAMSGRFTITDLGSINMVSTDWNNGGG